MKRREVRSISGMSDSSSGPEFSLGHAGKIRGSEGVGGGSGYCSLLWTSVARSVPGSIVGVGGVEQSGTEQNGALFWTSNAILVPVTVLAIFFSHSRPEGPRVATRELKWKDLIREVRSKQSVYGTRLSAVNE